MMNGTFLPKAGWGLAGAAAGHANEEEEEGKMKRILCPHWGRMAERPRAA